MTKLITPPGMLLTVALLAIYSAYAFSIGLVERSWLLIAGGVVSVVACYGAAMLRGWSKYLVYALALGFVAKLLSSFLDAIRAGYFRLHFGSAREILWSLTPSLLMVALSFLCCGLVYRHFRSTPGVPTGSPAAPVVGFTESLALSDPPADA